MRDQENGAQGRSRTTDTAIFSLCRKHYAFFCKRPKSLMIGQKLNARDAEQSLKVWEHFVISTLYYTGIALGGRRGTFHMDQFTRRRHFFFSLNLSIESA